MNKIINVCCAIIPENGKILAVQRGPESRHAWLWEFPGGKIQENETAEACIVREIEEELTVKVAADARLEAVSFDYEFGRICLIPFVCRIVSGTISLTEHVDQEWLSVDKLDSVNWSGADRELIRRNQKSLTLLLRKAL